MATQLRFFEDRLAVAHNFEPTAPRRNQFYIRFRKARTNLSRQTGGSWFVVSNDAVFYADIHFVGAPIDSY
jgi:hypothetical protein